MDHITEGPRRVPVLLDTEVLVVGGGPAGIAAAIAAARAGAHTTLLDRYGCFGGVITQVGVETIAWYRHEGTTDVEGIGIEFEQRARAFGGTSARAPVSERIARSGALQSRRRHAAPGSRRGAGPALPCDRTPDGRRHGHRRRHREQVRPPGDPREPRHRRHRRRRHRLSRGGAVPHDPRRGDGGRDGHALVLGRGQAAVPRLRGRLCPHLPPLERGLAHDDVRQGGRSLQPVSAGTVRPGARGGHDPGRRQEPGRHLGSPHGRGRGDLPQRRVYEGLRLHRRDGPDARRDRRASSRLARDRGPPPVRSRLRGGEAAQLRHDAGHARLAQDPGLLRPHRGRRARRGSLCRLGRHLPRVHRRLRPLGPADHRPVLPGAVRDPRAQRRRQPARRRSLRGRRQGVPRVDAQPDVLRRDRTGRWSGRRRVAHGRNHHRQQWTSRASRRRWRSKGYGCADPVRGGQRLVVRRRRPPPTRSRRTPRGRRGRRPGPAPRRRPGRQTQSG